MTLGVVLLSDDFTEKDSEQVARVLEEAQSVNVDVCILLTSNTVPDFISNMSRGKFTEKVIEISNQDFISGFHTAKDKLDEVMCPKIKVICKRKQEVSFLCQVIFTPAVQWSIVSFGEDQSLKSETLEIITQKVKDYLTKLKASDDVKILRSTLIPDDLFYHGFSTRTGGLSSIPGMKSLNVLYTTAKRDPLVLIEENRRRLASKAGFEEETLYIAKAVHGNTVYEIGSEPPDGGYDGVISNQSNMNGLLLCFVVLITITICSFAEAVDRPAICYLPWEHGTRCRARKQRWWFNPETEVCQKMIYGGCGKNENFFFDRNECAATCNERVTVSLVECYQTKSKGVGHGWLMRYYYNFTKQKCLRFIYKGSGGNTNRFLTKEECNRRCVM